MVGVVIAGVYMIAEGDLTQGGLIALVILSRQVLATHGAGGESRHPFPARQGGPQDAQRHHGASRGEACRQGLPAPDPLRWRHRDQEPDLFLSRVRAAKVLNNITLEIRAGEKVGIIGPIGSGKTTLGKLMLGLYEPISGMVTMDGTDIRQIDPTELRRFIGYVPQDIQLFRGTVRNNVTMGTHDVDDMSILRAAELAGVDEFVKKHSLGFDMEIGELGRGLSGGQRQCIVIARALLARSARIGAGRADEQHGQPDAKSG